VLGTYRSPSGAGRVAPRSVERSAAVAPRHQPRRAAKPLHADTRRHDRPHTVAAAPRASYLWGWDASRAAPRPGRSQAGPDGSHRPCGRSPRFLVGPCCFGSVAAELQVLCRRSTSSAAIPASTAAHSWPWPSDPADSVSVAPSPAAPAAARVRLACASSFEAGASEAGRREGRSRLSLRGTAEHPATGDASNPVPSEQSSEPGAFLPPSSRRTRPAHARAIMACNCISILGEAHAARRRRENSLCRLPAPAHGILRWERRPSPTDSVFPVAQHSSSWRLPAPFPPSAFTAAIGSAPALQPRTAKEPQPSR